MQSEGAADEARKEGSGGDTHSMIGTQEAVARVCGTKTNGTEPTNDSGYVEQVRVDNVVRQEVESGDAARRIRKVSKVTFNIWENRPKFVVIGIVKLRIDRTRLSEGIALDTFKL
jgi:hypothetical protein